jgi:cell division protein FtsI (penicillin-binding protein 3)
VAQALVRIFPDEDVDALTKRLATGEPGYLRRRILPEEANRVHTLGEPALEFPRENERYYPQGSMGAHILGFVDNNGHGQVGLEKVYDQRLTDPAQRGTPFQLSIDARVQGALEADLAWGMARAQARSAAGIVMDVDTGEVMAMASLPAFNPNAIDAEGAKHTFNLISSQPFELGSVMKPITVAIGIDGGVLRDMATRYPAGASARWAATLFTMTPISALSEHSRGAHPFLEHRSGAGGRPDRRAAHDGHVPQAGLCRAAAYRIARARHAHLAAPGFARALDPGQHHHRCLWPWYLDHRTASGLRLCGAGERRRVAPGDAAEAGPEPHPEGRRIWKASTSARIRQLLRAIVSNGTGRSANAAGYRIGGKTGTAERSDAQGYHKDKVVTTFASAFPMDKPRYVVITTLDEPQRNAATSFQRTAAWNAAPIVGRLIPKIGPCWA